MVDQPNLVAGLVDIRDRLDGIPQHHAVTVRHAEIVLVLLHLPVGDHHDLLEATPGRRLAQVLTLRISRKIVQPQHVFAGGIELAPAGADDLELTEQLWVDVPFQSGSHQLGATHGGCVNFVSFHFSSIPLTGARSEVTWRARGGKGHRPSSSCWMKRGRSRSSVATPFTYGSRAVRPSRADNPPPRAEGLRPDRVLQIKACSGDQRSLRVDDQVDEAVRRSRDEAYEVIARVGHDDRVFHAFLAR